MGDPEQPRPEVAPGPKAVDGRKSLEERFLGDVLGRGAVPSQPAKPAVQAVPVPLDQNGKGRPIARLSGPDQIGLIAGWVAYIGGHAALPVLTTGGGFPPGDR